MNPETKRLPRLTAILVQLMSRRLTNASTLAAKFQVSVRTIYRDIRTLEQAGVPIVTEEGKGYALLEGYKLPPIMLTENEANALLTAELLIRASRDESLIEAFAAVTAKVKAVLPPAVRLRAEQLEQRVGVTNYYIDNSPKSTVLLTLQRALLDMAVVEMTYRAQGDATTRRAVEPFALFANKANDWVLVAYCRLRQDFRSFSLAGIAELRVTAERFAPHKLTFQQYLAAKYPNNANG